MKQVQVAQRHVPIILKIQKSVETSGVVGESAEALEDSTSPAH